MWPLASPADPPEPLLPCAPLRFFGVLGLSKRLPSPELCDNSNRVTPPRRSSRRSRAETLAGSHRGAFIAPGSRVKKCFLLQLGVFGVLN